MTMFEELISSSPFAVIELFELVLRQEIHGTNETYRFHNGSNGNITATGDIIWRGNPYVALPVQTEGFEYNGNGQLPRPRLKVANLLGTVSAILVTVNNTTPGNDLTGALFRRIRTLSRFIDPVNFPNSINPYGLPTLDEMPQEIYYVDRKVAETREYVEFELAAAFDLAGVRAPKRQAIANICQWQYRSPECGYTGTNYFDENDRPVTLVPAANLASGLSQVTAGQIVFQGYSSGTRLVSSNLWYESFIDGAGILVIKAKNGNTVWSIGSAQYPADRYTVTGDGNFELSLGFTGLRFQSNTARLGDPNSITFNLAYFPNNTPDPSAAWEPFPEKRDQSGNLIRNGYVGHRLAFFHEIMGSAQSQQGVTKTETYQFTFNGKDLTLRFTAVSTQLPAGHWSGQSWGWQDSATSTYPTATITSSTGLFKQNEVFSATVQLGSTNPFRNPPYGVMGSVTGSFRITSTSGYSANYLRLTNQGQLTLYNAANTVLWQSSYSSTAEPSTSIAANKSLDVCGKRLSSCKARFGQNAQLPFGSFPGVGGFV